MTGVVRSHKGNKWLETTRGNFLFCGRVGAFSEGAVLRLDRGCLVKTVRFREEERTRSAVAVYVQNDSEVEVLDVVYATPGVCVHTDKNVVSAEDFDNLLRGISLPDGKYGY